jgi:hypothetical protein
VNRSRYTHLIAPAPLDRLVTCTLRPVSVQDGCAIVDRCGAGPSRSSRTELTAVIESVVRPAIFLHVLVVALLERDGRTPGGKYDLVFSQRTTSALTLSLNRE